ncbi:MAG: SulP family inorganic anion transporter [Gammaproteobacteria bacterium]|nr:SulP family inorganic anion transporter [Gammaproteobacteria bacterium]MDE0281453.1 SulP family inorganic anion transporter [Gammaproteobacteria bacterium]
MTTGLGLLVAQVAFGSLIFSGPLAPYSSQGIGLVLFGNFASCLVIALLGGFRGAIGGLSPALVIVMATVGLTMEAEGHVLFVTTACTLMAGALVTGMCCLGIGYFRLSNLVRFIPYPVSGGFVAGIGGAVCLAAVSLMGVDPDWRAIPALFEPGTLWKWGPGVVYGVALYLAMKRWNAPLILPVSVVVFVGACHLILAALDISGSEARAAGLLLTSTAGGGLWPVLGPSDLAHVDWAAMVLQIPVMTTLVLVALICVVMNIAGLEMVVNQELDWNREFRVTGLASVIAGLGGCTAAALIVPASLRSKLFGAATRLTGVVAALVIGGALLLGDGILESVPVPLVGGILIFAGSGMLDQGLLRTCKRLPRGEYGIILLIFFVILAFGLFEGVGAGMVATLVFFAVNLGRTDVIGSGFTGRERRSSKVRSVPDRAILTDRGDRVHACRLQGYIFFGSVCPLIDRLRRLLDGPARPDCLILDFSAVIGLDFSSVNALSRFLRSADEAGILVILSALPEQFRTELESSLPPGEFDRMRIEPDVECALEHCEEVVIAAWRKEADTTDEERPSLLDLVSDRLEHHLERQIRFEDLMDELQDRLEFRHCAADEMLSEPGATGGVQLLVSGRASAWDSTGRRVRQYGPGDVIWPAGPEEVGTMPVIADESCRTTVLTPAILERLEQHEVRIALRLYRYLLAGCLPDRPAGGR